MTIPPSPVPLDGYPLRTFDIVRYADTDRQGHVNNAVFSTYLESGRVALLYDVGEPMADPGASFVIARLKLDFRGETNWPGRIDIGTRVTSVGRSSIALEQGLFQDGRCVANAETVIVHMDESTRRSKPLSDAAVRRLERLAGSPALEALEPRRP
jgi:acyl-CoA thioester hydrolase